MRLSGYNPYVAYFLGIDGGATKTHVILSDRTGGLVAEAKDGPSNYHLVGSGQAGNNIAAAISRALAESTVDPADVQSACAGMAGFDGPSDMENVQQLLKSVLAGCGFLCPWRSVNDSVVAWAGAFLGGPGALIAAGSRAVAFAVGCNGISARADGLGHWLGDAGSGFNIGRAGLRAAVAALDGRGPATCLADSFLAVAGHSAQDWVDWIADLDTSIAHAHFQLRSFAPFVTRAADAGDSVALSILENAGAELAATAVSVLRKVKHLTAPRVATAGTVLEESRQLRRAFQSELSALLPGCQFVPARAAPAYGASLLARKPALLPKDTLQAHGQPLPG
ncbi:MAG: hypothetical protein OXO48_20910 [Caldilineaceae bacterium]|nr:hypothetical protein [Caldilineaceae bacterium]